MNNVSQIFQKRMSEKTYSSHIVIAMFTETLYPMIAALNIGCYRGNPE